MSLNVTPSSLLVCTFHKTEARKVILLNFEDINIINIIVVVVMTKAEDFLRDVPFPNASGQYLIVFFFNKSTSTFEFCL